MPGIRFQAIDSFTFHCFLNGKQIGKVYYVPSVYFSWVFCNLERNIQTFGSTKYQAVKLYVTVFLQKEVI